MKYNLDIYNDLNLLCVEDDLTINYRYKSLFSKFFKNVYAAKDGKEGIEIFKNNKIDIILTDYLMPNMDGLEMSKEIRKIDNSVPIILITAFEDINILKHAIDLRVSGFIKKPITTDSIFSVLEFVAKSVISERLLIEKQRKNILYNKYQEELTFKKESTIIKNDLKNCNKLLNFICEFFYKPKDILNGDSYIIRKLKNNEYVMFLVDGMGKGISASTTAMLCSAFVNYQIEEMKTSFSFEKLIKNLINFIKPNLLEEEIICSTFIYFNNYDMKYALFSMPPILYDENNIIKKIKSNNPPITKYTNEIKIDKFNISKINKMLIYTDGVNENITKDKKLYGNYLIKDFKSSMNLTDLIAKMQTKIISNEDDITMIYLNKNFCYN